MSQSVLVPQNEALTNFLEDLLAEDTEDSNLSIDEFLDNSLDESESITEPPVESELTADAVPVIEPEPVLKTTEAVMTEPVSPDHSLPPSMDNGRTPVLPDWGLKPFQAMIFKVGQLSLAIPVTELEGVIEWKPERLTGPVGSGLCLGHYPHDGQLVSVIDIAQLVFAGSELDDSIQSPASQRITRIILIDNLKLGLAVDAVFEMITIRPTRVNWRSTRTRRQWLAGTMLDDMIVVLDAKSTAKILSGMLADSG